LRIKNLELTTVLGLTCPKCLGLLADLAATAAMTWAAFYARGYEGRVCQAIFSQIA